MPLRAYHALRQPPSALDHTLAHPWEIPFGAFQVIAGIYGIVSAFVRGLGLGPSVESLPILLSMGLCLALLIGGALMIAGLFDDGEDLMVGYRRERTGLIFTGAAWGVWGFIVLWRSPGSVLAYMLAFVLCTGASLRLWATFREEKRIRASTNGT